MHHFCALKRFTALLLAASIALSMAACGNGSSSSAAESPSGSSSTPQSAQSSQPAPTSTPTPEPEKPDDKLLEQINNAYNQNNDVIGWLSIDGTTIDAEVLQGEDNEEYVRSDITKNYNWYGCYYADYENTFGDRNDLSQNTVIYGHNMTDNPEDVMFAQLMKYTDIDFARSHPYIKFSTPEDDMVWKVFAVLYTEPFPYNYVEYPITYSGGTFEFTRLVGEFRDRSIYDYDVDVNMDDKLLTLSTCTYKFGNHKEQRYLVVARLVRPGEAVDDATVNVEVNPSIKEPNFS